VKIGLARIAEEETNEELHGEEIGRHDPGGWGALPWCRRGMVAKQTGIHPVPGEDEGCALPAQFRPGSACRCARDAPHFELSRAPGLHGAFPARLAHALHEYALRKQ